MILNILISLHALVHNNTYNNQELMMAYSLVLLLLFLFGASMRKIIKKSLKITTSVYIKFLILLFLILGTTLVLLFLKYLMVQGLLSYAALLLLALLGLVVYIAVRSGYKIQFFGKSKK